jgi:hypothetical protein
MIFLTVIVVMSLVPVISYAQAVRQRLGRRARENQSAAPMH